MQYACTCAGVEAIANIVECKSKAALSLSIYSQVQVPQILYTYLQPNNQAATQTCM